MMKIFLQLYGWLGFLGSLALGSSNVIDHLTRPTAASPLLSPLVYGSRDGSSSHIGRSRTPDPNRKRNHNQRIMGITNDEATLTGSAGISLLLHCGQPAW